MWRYRYSASYYGLPAKISRITLLSMVLLAAFAPLAMMAQRPPPAGPQGGPLSGPGPRRNPLLIPRGPARGGTPAYARPIDVTTITINDTTVGLCRREHSCRSLGCQPQSDKATPLCYCDSACVFFDDCCYDVSESCGQRQPDSGRSSGQNFTEIELQSFSCVSPNERSTSFYLVSSCPAENTDIQTAALCEDPDTDDVLASIPCYGKNSGVHFRNIYCALCNGEDVSGVVAWKVVVDCEAQPSQNDNAASLLQMSIANLDRVEKELGCDVVIEAPDGDDVTKPPRHCYPDAVRHCPTPHHNLSIACESYTALTVTGADSEQIYKNPHCALCNLPTRSNRIEFATDCGKDLPVFYLNVPVDDSFLIPYTPGGQPGLPGPDLKPQPGPQPRPQPPPPPISILFDFRSDSNVKIVQNREVLVTKTIQCPLNEVYDPFVSRCRRLSCSKGYLLQENRCVPDFKSLGQACEDSGGDDGVDIGVTVSFGERCQDGQENNDDRPTHNMSRDIQLCLAEFLGRDQRSLQVASSTLAPSNCSGVAMYSFSVNATGETLMDFREVLKLSLPNSPLCQVFNSRETWSLELSQNCENLPANKCTGRWLNDTEYSLPVHNGTTLVFVNASESWYTLNQTIIRANFKRRENSFEKFTDVQICSEPTLACPRVILNSSLFKDDKNYPGSIIYTPAGNVFKRDEYIRAESGEIEVCSFYETNGTRNGTTSATFFNFSTPQQVLSLIGNLISMTAAAMTFITYCVFKELRKRISLAIMSLVACLFLAQLLLLISGSATSNPPACTTVAFLGHFFWLSTVLWMGVLAFGLNRVFGFVSKIRRLEADVRVFVLQASFAFGGSMLIVLPCLIIHLCDCTDIPLSYGNENVCWIGNGYVNLVTFGVPVGATVLVNGVLFAFTINGIRSTKKQTKSLKQTDKTELQRMKQDLLIYIRISSLMGFTWIFGFVAAFSDVIVLWYIFIVLNSCQGLLIFMSFIFNKKVWSLWRTLICGGRGDATQTPGSTSFTPSSQAMLQPIKTKSTQSSALTSTV